MPHQEIGAGFKVELAVMKGKLSLKRFILPDVGEMHWSPISTCKRR